MNYLGIVFCASTWTNCYAFMKATNFYMFIALPVLLAYSRGTNMVGRAKKVSDKLAAKTTKAE